MQNIITGFHPSELTLRAQTIVPDFSQLQWVECIVVMWYQAIIVQLFLHSYFLF